MASAQIGAQPAADASRRILVVLQLAGGNDGINTVIPYGDPLYYQARPSLAIPREQVLPLERHGRAEPGPGAPEGALRRRPGRGRAGRRLPEPEPLALPSDGHLADGRAGADEPTGWLGRYLQACSCGTDKQLEGISMGSTVQKSFWTELTLVPAISNLAAFRYGNPRANPDASQYEVEALRRALSQARGRPEEEFLRQATRTALDDADTMERVAQGYQTTVAYPQGQLGQSLKTIAQVIAGDVGTRVFFATLGGFDTHANQPFQQQRLLTELDGAIDAFMQDLERLKRQDDVLLMTFSEFGRRVQRERQQRHRPRHGRAAVHGRRRGPGRAARRLPEPVRPGSRRPEVHDRLPLGVQLGAPGLAGRRRRSRSSAGRTRRCRWWRR